MSPRDEKERGCLRGERRNGVVRGRPSKVYILGNAEASKTEAGSGEDHPYAVG